MKTLRVHRIWWVKVVVVMCALVTLLFTLGTYSTWKAVQYGATWHDAFYHVEVFHCAILDECQTDYGR